MPKDNIKKQVKGDGLIDESTSSIKEVDPKVANSKPINKKSDLIGDFVDKSLGGVRKWFTKRTEANKKAAKNKKIESKEENSDKLPEKDNQKNSEELNAGEDKNGSLKQDDSAKKGSFTDLLSFFSNKKNETTQGNHKFDLAGTLDLSPEHMAKLSPEEKKQIIEAEKIFREGVASIRDLIAPSYFESSLKYLRLGGLFVRSFYVFSYPRFIETNWLSPVINMEAILDVSQYIYPMESSKIMNTLRRKVTQMSASVHMNQAKGVVSDVGLETALEDAEDEIISIKNIAHFVLDSAIFACIPQGVRVSSATGSKGYFVFDIIEFAGFYIRIKGHDVNKDGSLNDFLLKKYGVKAVTLIHELINHR